MTERIFESEPTLAARLERERLSRFELLKKSGITGLVLAGSPALLGALAETASAARRPAAAPKAPTPTGTVDFFSWEGYDFPNKYVPTMAAWKKKYGLKLKSTYIGNHDDIQAKIKGGGGGGIDLITYYQGYKPLYKELEIITPLDPDKLPNLKNLFPFFASKEKNFWVDADGTRTGVPMFWGALGINYDTAASPKAPTTYDILLEPKWKGKVAIVDDPVGVYTLAGHILGYDIGKMTSAQFDKASDWLKALVKQSRGISPSYGDASTRLVSGDAVFAWPGWAAVNEFAAGAGKKTIRTTLPKEGGYSFCDSYAIPPTTDNRDSALAWINEGIDAHVNAEAANYLAGGTTCAASVKYLKKGIAALYDYRKLEKFLAKAPFYENPPVESDKYATQAQVQSGWQQVKASA